MKTNRTKTIDYGLLVNSLENECMYFSSNSNPFLASAKALPYEPLKNARELSEDYGDSSPNVTRQVLFLKCSRTLKKFNSYESRSSSG